MANTIQIYLFLPAPFKYLEYRMKYKFSGHETFNCRPIWLKKGYNYANKGKQFNDDAVVELGVGKNMVTSIKFWLRAFGFYNLHKNELEGLSYEILDDDGYDPFLENDATLYLLHYLLIKNIKTSSIYYLAFIKFSKEKLEFTSENLLSFIERECLKEDVEFNENTLKNDVNVFLKNYIPSNDKKNGLEDNFSGLFYDLSYISKVKSLRGDSKYRFNINDGKHLPEVVFLYVLLEKFKDVVSISMEALREDVSSIFLMEKQGTYSMIERLVNKYPDLVTFKDDGGRQEVQLKEGMNKAELLKEYYENV